MNGYNEAARILPPPFCSALLIQPEYFRENAEEIRLRSGQALSLLVNGEECEIETANKVSVYDLECVLERATEASVHAVDQELSKGFISVKCGIRLGICGTAIIRCGEISGMRDLSSVSIRIPHEIYDCGTQAFNEIISEGFDSILIISPPGCGKTTCMRDYIRKLSNRGFRVSVADERYELAGVFDGEPQFDIGRRTDVISGAPKNEAAMMLIRAMNPDIIAMDEISSEKDIAAAETAMGCGIKLLATAHADEIESLYKRPLYRKLMDLKIFKYAVIIENTNGVRSYITKELY